MVGQPIVYITRQIPSAGIEMLEEECDVYVWDDKLPPAKEHIMQRLRELEANGLLCLLSDDIDEEVMNASPDLKAISTFSVGYDHIDLASAENLNLSVGHTPGVLSETTADFAWALLMTAARRTVEGHKYVKDGEWETWGPTLLTGPDIHGTTLGVIGLGDIGARVAQRAAGFNMNILYSDVNRRKDTEEKIEKFDVNISFVDQDIVLEQSDFISIHTPLIKETHHLISEEELKRMNDSAILINTSRGPIVDTEALDTALENDWIARAGLDVTDPEPLPHDHSIMSHTPDKLIITPHIASASIQTRAKMSKMAAENLLAGLKGEELPNSALRDHLGE